MSMNFSTTRSYSSRDTTSLTRKNINRDIGKTRSQCISIMSIIHNPVNPVQEINALRTAVQFSIFSKDSKTVAVKCHIMRKLLLH
jgi:hypothetical protein